MAKAPEFRIILDKIMYGGKTVGSEWLFEFDFVLTSSNTLNITHTIARTVKAGKPQTDINKTIYFDTPQNLKAGTQLTISGKIKAREEGSNEKYAESGNGKLLPLVLKYTGDKLMDVFQSNEVEVQEYKGPRFDNMSGNIAKLTFEFKVLIEESKENPCDNGDFTGPEIVVLQDLMPSEFGSAEKNLRAGATKLGRSDLQCCVAKNAKGEFKATIKKAKATVRWGVDMNAFKEPSVSGSNPNITNCAKAKDATRDMEYYQSGIKINDPMPWFPQTAVVAHELSHVEDYEKAWRDNFEPIRKDLEKKKLNLPADADAAALKAMQDKLAEEYGQKWYEKTNAQIGDIESAFFATSEKMARQKADPIITRAVKLVNDYKKEKKC